MVYGIRGDSLPEEEMSNEDIEIYGVDWEALSDDQLLRSQGENNSTNEGSTSWIGQTGPPQHLNEVPLYPPSSDVLTSAELLALAETVHPWYGLPDDENKFLVWSHGLGYVKAIRGNIF